MMMTEEERQCIMYGLATLCVLSLSLLHLSVMLEYMEAHYILFEDAIIEEVVREYLELPECRPELDVIYL